MRVFGSFAIRDQLSSERPEPNENQAHDAHNSWTIDRWSAYKPARLDPIRRRREYVCAQSRRVD